MASVRKGLGRRAFQPTVPAMTAVGTELMGREGEASAQKTSKSGAQRDIWRGFQQGSLKLSTKKHQTQISANNPQSRCTHFQNKKYKTSHFVKAQWSVYGRGALPGAHGSLSFTVSGVHGCSRPQPL